MNTEIEAKIKVDSLEQIAEKLKSLGAEYKHSLNQRDTYFDAHNDVMVKSDRGLRLRRQQEGKGEKILLTYKGPKQKTQFKSRLEIEVQVSDFAAMTEMLTALGYEKKLAFEKRRAMWLFDGCAVCLDELPLLGEFVEVEGPDEQAINSVLQKLGLEEKGHISQTYSKMIADKLDS